MASLSASASPTQSQIGVTFPVTPQFIGRRDEREAADGGGYFITLGLSKADKKRLGCNIVELVRTDDEPAIELHQRLELTITGRRAENYRARPFVALQADATIIPFTPKSYNKVDNIPAADCRKLEGQFGFGFAQIIAQDPEVLGKFKYSKERKEVIVRACVNEAKAEAKEDPASSKIVAMLCACGVTKGKARRLAADYDGALGLYQFLYKGQLSFLQADRAARLIDPARAAEDRVTAFVVDQFLDNASTVVPERDIRLAIWKDFGADYPEVTVALDRLVRLGVVKKCNGPNEPVIRPAVIELNERVASSAFGEGIILAINTAHIPFVRVKFNDGAIRNMAIDSVFAPIRDETPTYLYGLTPFVEAEEKIAGILSRNTAVELTAEELAIIDWICDHADFLLNRPGFKLNSDQRSAILSAFQWRFTIITGPPGTGKTAIVALISAVAARIYPNETAPVLGIALAGRAASVLREAATWFDGEGVAVPMPAMTIHRALNIPISDDDDFEAYDGIEIEGLIAEEMSMNSSPLVPTVLINTSARHIIFIGDRHQLQPIGHGQPFADMIASKVIQTIYLTENFRTSCKGIQALCADVLSASVTPKKVPGYEDWEELHSPAAIGRTRPLWRPNCMPTWWMSGVIRIRSPLSAPTNMVTAGYAPSTRSCARRSACRIIGSPGDCRAGLFPKSSNMAKIARLRSGTAI